jgi:uncharacterized protein (TIGR03086 family)
MTEIADRFQRLSDGFLARAEAVPADAWDNPSPCEGWKARDVVRHVVDTYGMFLGFVGQKLPSGPSVDEDPAGAYRSARDAVLAGLRKPDVAAAEYESPMFGMSRFDTSVDRFLAADAVVHAWDLARATGGDERLEIDEVKNIGEALAPMDEVMRGPGAFGPKLEPPEGADEQTRFLAFLGRKAW